MISKPNNDDASTVAGSSARFTLLGLLLLSFGLLLSVFQPVVAQTYTLSPTKNYSVSPGGLDLVTITENPAVTGTQQIFVSVDGSTSLYQVTLTNGVGTFPFTHSVGTAPLVFYSDPFGLNQVGSITMNFIAAPGPPDPTKSYFVVNTNGATSNGVAQDVVEAFLFDANGNPVVGPATGATVTWTVPAPAVPVGSPITAVTGAGTATLGLTDNSGLTQTVDVTAIASYTDPVTHLVSTFALQDQSTPPNSFLAANFVQPTPNTTPGTSYIVTVVSPNPADNSTQDEVEVYLVDGSNVALTNYPVTFTYTGPGGLTLTTTGKTNGAGLAYAYYATSNSVPGTYQITATVLIGGVPSTIYLQGSTTVTSAPIVFYNPPPSTTASWITPVITPVVVGGQDEVEVHLASTTGPLVGATVAITAPSGVTIVTPGPYVTDANGNVFVYLTSTIANQPFDIVATYTDPAAPGNPTYTLNDETITTQPYSIVQWVPAAVSTANSYIVVTQDNSPADDQTTDIVTAYLFDQFGNAITGNDNPNLAWNVTSPTGSTPIPTKQAQTSTPTGNVYTISYVSTAVGPFTVTLQANGITVNEQTTNNPNVTIHFVTSTPVTGDPGGPSNGGNPGGGNPGNGGPPPNNGGGSGPGIGGGTGPNSNNGYTVLYTDALYNNRLADGQQQDSVYALITDQYKHPIPNTIVTFYIAIPPLPTNSIGSITSGEQWTPYQTVTQITDTTGPDGIARAAMTSTATGSVFVYATIVVGGVATPIAAASQYAVNATDVPLYFVTKPDVTNIQTALTVIVGQALSDGIQQNVVKAHVVDLDGNVMPDQPVYFAIDSGTGTIITPQPVLTDANGDAYIQITSKTTGYVLITAVVDSEKIVFGSPARVYFAQINIYVPRAFSPNNDGVNDLLKPILVGITTFHYFSIYNRWGNLIFTTQDPNQGWDGTFKGVPQPVETYLWIAEGIDENGRKVVQKGMTSLVR